MISNRKENDMVQSTLEGGLRLNNEKGGIALRIVVICVTLLVVGMSVFVILDNLGQHQQVNHRKALAVSEFGLMKALQKVSTGIFEFSDIPKTECEEGYYSVSFSKIEKNDTVYLLIVSKGYVGSTSETRECTLRLEKYDTTPVWVQDRNR